MDPVRMGVIGIGTMGAAHARRLAVGEIAGACLAAVCDPREQAMAAFPDVAAFTDYKTMICSGKVDAVIIATTHFQHPDICITALERGLHVLVEKPVAVHKAACERMLDAHENPDQVFAAMLNQRTDPLYRRVRTLVQSGKLGTLQRINWTVTDWFRPQVYYDMAAWRGTWKGEGGGVLLNQATHNLDLWQWIFGMPHAVRGFCRLGRHHAIEVEDQVTAYLEYVDGAQGSFVTSTGEAPGCNRLEIAGSRGRLVAENRRITVHFNDTDTRSFSRTTKEPFSAPNSRRKDIFRFSEKGGQHGGIIQNFTNTIQYRSPLIAPAAEGVCPVELGNAILYSSLLDRPVTLPLDGYAFEDCLYGLGRGSAKAGLCPGMSQ